MDEQRIIKFRVWDKETNQFCKTDDGLYFNMTRTISLDKQMWISISAFILKTYRFSIQQFTGLSDKNGKEIYERDIVKSSHFGGEIATVKWNEEDCGFEPFNFKVNGEYYMGEWDKDAFEIIGNIFENPELIK